MNTNRDPRQGYREHDHATEWQECDSCYIRLGACIVTEWDEIYYSDAHDPDDCPRCGVGWMCLPERRSAARIG